MRLSTKVVPACKSGQPVTEGIVFVFVGQHHVRHSSDYCPFETRAPHNKNENIWKCATYAPYLKAFGTWVAVPRKMIHCAALQEKKRVGDILTAAETSSPPPF